MNLFNKKVNLLLLICFAFVSMNAQQSNSDNNDQPVKTADATKNTYVADPANSDNGDVAPEGYIPKNTYVAPAKMDNDGVEKVAEKKAKPSPAVKPATKKDVTKAPEVDLAAPTVEEVQDGSVEKASTDPKVVDADGDGKIDNPESVKTSTAKVSKTNVMKDEDKDQDGVIDKPGTSKTKKANN